MDLHATELADFPISEWLYVNTRLIWATAREVEPEYCNHPFSPGGRVFAWFVKQGQVKVEAGGRAAVARNGEWIFPGLVKGRQIIRPGTVILSICFTAQWPTGVPLFDHALAVVFAGAKDRKLTNAGRNLERVVGRAARRGGFFRLEQGTATVMSYFEIRLAFEQWLAAYIAMMLRIGRQPSVMSRADERVMKAARLIYDAAPGAALKESELARKCGLSVSQLNRLFLRDLGTSPKQCMERRRLEEALLLLRGQRRSIKETAFYLGFSSLPHFSAWFRRRHGMSPREFQQGGG